MKAVVFNRDGITHNNTVVDVTEFGDSTQIQVRLAHRGHAGANAGAPSATSRGSGAATGAACGCAATRDQIATGAARCSAAPGGTANASAGAAAGTSAAVARVSNLDVVTTGRGERAHTHEGAQSKPTSQRP